ncbi:MAG: hypothetical protein BWY71_01616 [Planctomycetes bacterium ADurb.Bin412]|nr:MAG: hypothetical protein BWY71_01616 [Planctomycetes bacterium ADurb.Bin412]
MPTETFRNLPESKRLQIEQAAITEFAANPLGAPAAVASVWGWNLTLGTYTAPTAGCTPGQGYWIYCDQAGTVIWEERR